MRHSHRKRGETDRPRLRSTAPALDPTGFFPGAQPACLGHYLAPMSTTRSRLGVPNLHARAQRQPALEASNTKTARFGARTLRLLLPEVCRSRHAQEVRNKPHFRSRSRILISERSVCADGRGGRHEAAKHGRSKPRNQRWIDFLRSTMVPADRRLIKFVCAWMDK